MGGGPWGARGYMGRCRGAGGSGGADRLNGPAIGSLSSEVKGFSVPRNTGVPCFWLGVVHLTMCDTL